MRQAIRCCWPRLKAELDRFPNVYVLNLGAHAMHATTDGDKIDDERGYLRPLRESMEEPEKKHEAENPTDVPF